MDKFKFEDLQNPLYEHSQVITEAELIGIHNGLVLQLKTAKWYHLNTRTNLTVLIHFVRHLLSWLQKGKPVKHIGENHV